MCRDGFDAGRNAFVQSFGATALDASLLQIPLVGFLPADDPRVRGTVAAIERELLANGLVLRYDTGTAADGLPPGEGAFLACSFWLADNYAMLGRAMTKRGRCSSDCSPCATTSGCSPRNTTRPTRRQLGNFPQAFSHLALISTARNLARALGPAHVRSRRSAAPDGDRARPSGGRRRRSEKSP